LGTKNEARYNLKIVDNGEPPAGRPARSDDNASASTPSDSASSDNTPAATADDQVLDDLDEITAPTERESDVVSKTRKELEELDDLDV
jgi:hypothetical protein